MTLPWRLMYWNGSAWTNAEQRRWDGSAWVTNNSYYWNGSSWVLLTDRTPPTQIYNEQYFTIWHSSYRGNNNIRVDSDGQTYNFQGNANDGLYGRQKSMWGYGDDPFDDLQGSVAYLSIQV